jgi:non-canonical (house-cleaning) NTP pyrophosphatase
MAQSSPASKYPFVDIQLGRRGKETGDVFDLETDHMQIEQRIGIVARRCWNDQGR